MKELKIYGTLGPSCCTQEILEEMLISGMTGIRLNLSHCNLWDKKEWIDAFHQACTHMHQHADLMIDMCGPELRIQNFNGKVEWKDKTQVILNEPLIPRSILTHAQINDMILIDDGKLRLRVQDIQENTLLCEVIFGGLLKPRKSIMIEGKTILGPALTENDIKNLKEAKSFGVTAIMQPFVSCKEDLITLKDTLHKLNADNLKIYAKIENQIGLDHLEELIPYCDVLVIARGDLGNACGLIQLPKVQKQIERICHKHHKPYMVVTEMLNSMIDRPVPTRAEVSDVYHAVYHGASEIMLTAETASGQYPVEAMKIFVQVAQTALDDRKYLEEEK